MERTTPEVSLRPLDRTDAEVIARWAADPPFCREAGWTVDLSFAERRAALETFVESRPRELIRFAAVHGGVLIGYVDLHGVQAGRRELGFVVGERSRWGRGFGRPASTMALTGLACE